MSSHPARKVLVINGHPDPSPNRLCAGLAQAYADGASEAGLQVRRLAIGELSYPLVRTAADFAAPAREAVILDAQADIDWADHVFLVHPLWLGSEPALLKGFLEQVLRPGFALAEGSPPRGLLRGRSIRVAATMGMPAVAYRLAFGGPGLKALMPMAFFVSGFWPIRFWLIGGVGEASARTRAGWIAKARRLGRRGR